MKNHYRLIAVNLNKQKEFECRSESNSANRIRWTIKRTR